MRAYGLASALATWTWTWACVSAAQPAPLELDDVLRSVQAHHPQIAEAQARARAAQGRRLAASGGFDPMLKAEARAREGDGYDRRELNVELAQPTPAWGAELFAGYRLGRSTGGDSWPSYDPDKTLEGGEVRAGLRVPLYRGGPTDARRTLIETTRHLEHAAGHAYAGTQLELRLQAIDAYQRWVAAGRTLAAAEQLLALAEQRTQALGRALASGAIADVEVIDNERMRFEREERTAAARRGLERAALALALYYRGADGRPHVLAAERLPRDFTPPPLEHVDVDAVRERITGCHPDLREIESQIEAARAELRLSDNQVAPNVLGTAQVSRDLGESEVPALHGTAVEVGVTLSMPLALRPERGERAARRAALTQKEAELTLSRERLALLIADVASRLKAAYDRHEAAEGQVRASEALAHAERTRFQAGDSSLLFVNVREQAATDAELRRIEAALEARLALAHWQQLSAVRCAAAR